MDFVKSHPSTVLYVSYNQISIFKSGLEDPFNDWNDDHVAQGFSWRKESVSFKTISESGNVYIYVQIEDRITIYDNCLRAIMVPFELDDSNFAEIASITESLEIEIPKGKYNLIFQTGKFDNNEEWCLFSFSKDENNEAKILKADEDITKVDNLLMEAIPAK
jgi:hypothetical protein